MVEAPPSPRRPRVRRRIVAVLLVSGLVAASGVALDRLGPRVAAEGRPSGGRSGAWFCPHGGGEGWKGWVAIANPGSRSVRVRVTQLGKEGLRAVRTFTLGAGRDVIRSVDASDPSASTEVEYFGGWVGTSAIVRADDSAGGLSAEACEPSPRRTWYLLDVPTQVGESAYLVAMNPFAEAAEFDVTIRTEQRVVTPGALSPFVLPAHRSVAIRLNDYALAGQGEPTVVAGVRVRLGRVVAGALDLSSSGVRIAAGVPGARTAFAFPTGEHAGTREIVVFNVGSRRTDLSVLAQTSSGQNVVSGQNGVSIAGKTVRTLRFDGLGDGGASVVSSNRRPFVSAIRLVGTAGGWTTVAGSSQAASLWLVMPSAAGGAGSALLLQNPHPTPVQVRYRFLGSKGPVGDPAGVALTVAAGRTLVVPLSALAGATPVAVVVSAEGTLVAAGASSTRTGGYALVLGLPMTGAGPLVGPAVTGG